MSLSVSGDVPCIKETVVDNMSIARTYPLWASSSANKDRNNNCVAEPPDWVLSKPSDWTVSSLKKSRKSVSKRCAAMDAADDPASLLLIKKLRHEDLMDLHDHFKKSHKIASTAVLATKKTPTHGLAPRGMSFLRREMHM